MANYATRDNAEYIDGLWNQYKQNPSSVEKEWQKFFEGVEFGADLQGGGLSENEIKVYDLITTYRTCGHIEANLNPLSAQPAKSEELSLTRFGLTEKNLSETFQVGALIGKPNASLKDIIEHLRGCYCGTLTVQCADAEPQIQNWFLKEFESKKDGFKLTPEQKKSTLASISRAESIEKFIHTRYVGSKRFSVEGGDALIPMMDYLAEQGPAKEVQEIMIGMAHRGRVNILANIMGKGPEYIFADFNGPTETAVPIEDFDGDVKYHLGYHAHRKTAHGPMDLTLAFNPSHLEAVNPVVLGMARAAQRRRKDTAERKTVIPVLIHGDAAFSGQGIVLETFQMSQLKGYTVGGTIHLCIDNQIGFTTNPINSRSTRYSTDAARIIQAPVLHVNGDDAESCIRAMDIALRFRQEWKRDVVINIICYRRFGHNEGDEPAYTQPLMYDLIKKHPTLREIYSKKLISEGVATLEFCDGLTNENMDRLQKVYEQTKAQAPKIEPFKFDGFWKGLRKSKSDDFEKSTDTTFDLEVLRKIGHAISQYPSDFQPHPKLVKLLEFRKAVAESKEMMDWGTAELLAYGSLLHEGTSVRLSGQDCVRGTFTHRHAGLYDPRNNQRYMALEHINPEKTEFCVYDSVLSEYGVLGFEYGNALCDPTFLTIWEAQFGDFANGAQIIIDQFISAGESKWQQMCGLVMLLPHGYEGQGPEHSSARFERFLQLCAQNNMQVANLTTPSQIYHALRRQIRRPFRKPLVVMSPKSLLRHPKAVSSIEELAKGTFQEVIPDGLLRDSKKVETVALCTGKIYYDLLEEREKSKHERTALVRVEQLYPTPMKQIAAAIKSYPNLKNVVWVQEEPKNMGAYQFMYFKLSELFLKEGLTRLSLHYVGRGERSSPATGSPYRHKVEQAEIVKNCFLI